MKNIECIFRQSLATLFFALVSSSAMLADAAMIYVSPTGNDETGAGTRENPYATPAKGVSSARDGDEVVLLRGTYLTDKRVAWNKNIKVRGETFDRRETVVDFGGVVFPDCAVAFAVGSIHDLTISNATASGLWLRENSDIYASNVVVTCCSQSNSGRAGGVQLDAGSLIDCLITRNVSKSSCGGVKMAAGTLVSGCQVTYNDVGEEGFGGIGAPMDAASPIVVKDTLIAYNRARYAAGVGDVTVIDNCDILCNSSGVSRCNGAYSTTASSLGTAVLVRNSALDVCISNSVIRGNVSGGTGGGQGIYNNGVRLTVVNTDLLENETGSSDTRGGATICNASDNAVTVVFGGLIAGNVGRADGVVAKTDMGIYSFTGCTFSNNVSKAASSGLAVSVARAGAQVAFTNCTFTCHAASAGGAALFIHSGACEVVGCTFSWNTAAGRGGAVLLNSGLQEFRAIGCEFRANSATGNDGSGGAICGSIMDDVDCKLQVDGCRFVGNTSSKNGGAIFLRTHSSGDTSEILIRNSLFESNRCAGNGGAINYIANSALIDSCTFVKNATEGANGLGGSIYHRWGGLVRNSVIALSFCNTDQTETGTNWCNTQVPAGKSASADAYEYSLIWPALTTIFKEANHCKNADPLFADADGGDYVPASRQSPLYNAGLNEDWMVDSADVRGTRKCARIAEGTVDIGAYELNFPKGMMLILR